MITIAIKTNNAAFEGDNYGAEVARILRAMAYAVEHSPAATEMKFADLNGNVVATLITRRQTKAAA